MKIENNAKRATNETASRRVLISPLMRLYEATRKYRERKKAREGQPVRATAIPRAAIVWT